MNVERFTCQPIHRVRAVFYAHLAAVVIGAFVVRSNTILDNRHLEWLVALPLFFSLYLFPVVMLVVAVSQHLSLRVRLFAGAGAVVLSTIQLLEWLPTVQ